MSDSSSVLSDDTSEQEIFDHSLSMWRDKRPSLRESDDFSFKLDGDFEPLQLDLHTECGIGHYECVRSAVMSKNVELDKRNRGGWTPLMYACYTGHEAIVNLLIEAGVNLNLINNKLITPLMLASSCGNEGIVRILIEQGAHIDAVDHLGWTALFHATFSGQKVIVKHLLDCNADVELSEHSQGLTAFMEAAQAGHEGIVQYFLDQGVDTRLKNKRGNSVLTFAMLRGHSRIVSAIQEHNRKQEALKSKSQESPKSILKQTSALLEGPEAVKKLMKKLAFQDEQTSEQSNSGTCKSQLKPSTTTYKQPPLNPVTATISPTLLPQQASAQYSPRMTPPTTHSPTNFNNTPTTYKPTQATPPTNNSATTHNSATNNSATTHNSATNNPTTTNNSATTNYPATTNNPATTTTLQQLLHQLGLAKYSPIFQEQDVDLSIFLTLTDHDLKQIGINLLGPRKKMLMAISRWRNNNHNNYNNNNHNNHNNYNNNNDNKSIINNNINSMNRSSEQEIRDLILSLNVKKKDLEQQVKKESQVRLAVETCLIKERSHYHGVLVNTGNLINRYRLNSEELIRNLKESITSFVNQSGSDVSHSDQLNNHPVPISHLIGRELANQMLDEIRSSQSQEAFLNLKSSCDDIESFIRNLFEDMSSFLVVPLSN